MSTHGSISNDELKGQRVVAMGADLGSLYHELENDLAWLLRKQGEVGDLFADDKEQIALLNRVAPNFFYFLERMYYEDALLHIARLTDSAMTGGRSQQVNLTIQGLPGVVPDLTLRLNVQSAVDEAIGVTGFARRWRNKRLAHADLAVHRDAASSSLPEVRRQDITKAVDAIAEPLRRVARHFGVSQSLLTLADPWGSRALVEYLRRSEGEPNLRMNPAASSFCSIIRAFGRRGLCAFR